MAKNNDLSQRELEILELVATGASNKEIANSLVISLNTVKVHLKNIYGKLGVNTRTEAALYAIKSNILESHKISAGTSQSDLLVGDRLQVGNYNRIRRSNDWNMSLALVGIMLLAGVGIIILLRADDTTNSRNENATSRVSERLQIRENLPTPRTGLAVANYENQIYAIAGESEFGITGVVERYDPTTDEWGDLPPKPTAVKDVSAEVIGGLIYVPGGLTDSGTPVDVLEVFNPRNGTWSSRAALPLPIGGYSLAEFEGQLYVFGGWNGEEYLSTVFSYNPQTDSWTTLSPMGAPRGYAGAVVASGEIYIIGGFDGETALSSNDVYTPELDYQGGSPWGEAEPLPEPRYAMGIASVADIIHIVGGIGDDTGEFGLQYFPQQDSWQLISAPFQDRWSRMGMIGIESNLFILGGQVNESITDQFYSFQAIYSIVLPIIQ